MKNFFSKIREKFSQVSTSDDMDEEAEQDYVEIDTDKGDMKSKVIVRPFTLETFEDVKTVLDALREGSTISLVNIRPLKDKDLIELKRAINKLKKTCDAVEGEIAGFGEDYIVVTPSFAQIYKASDMSEIKDEQQLGIE